MDLTWRQLFERETGNDDDSESCLGTYIYKEEYICWLEGSLSRFAEMIKAANCALKHIQNWDDGREQTWDDPGDCATEAMAEMKKWLRDNPAATPAQKEG